MSQREGQRERNTRTITDAIGDIGARRQGLVEIARLSLREAGALRATEARMRVVFRMDPPTVSGLEQLLPDDEDLQAVSAELADRTARVNELTAAFQLLAAQSKIGPALLRKTMADLNIEPKDTHGNDDPAPPADQ